MSAKLLIGADLVPTESNYEHFKSGNVDALLGDELLKKLRDADFTIFNLEVPLTDKITPIEKCGPNLIAPTYTIKGLQAINPSFFSLANNHILDQGKQGLESTIKVLSENGIAYAGAGSNLEEAKRPFICEIEGIKIGIYCCAEHEFTIATERKAGANPFDPLETLEHVVELKNQCDYVIVLYHGGKEHFRYPSPELQKRCRKMIEKGADLVICQHSHCIGAEEEWSNKINGYVHNGRIIYGQGNFLFDDSDSEYWKTGLLIEIELRKKTNTEIKEENIDALKIHYYPLQKLAEKVRLAQEDNAKEILTQFQERSIEIIDPVKVERNYQKFADSMLETYLNAFMGGTGQSFFFRAINKVTNYRFGRWFIRHKYRNVDRIKIQNFIECEAHRELLLKGLSNLKFH